MDTECPGILAWVRNALLACLVDTESVREGTRRVRIPGRIFPAVVKAVTATDPHNRHMISGGDASCHSHRRFP
jgi:hypothetical protein